MLKRNRVVAWVLSLGLTLAACGSEEQNPSPGTNPDRAAFAVMNAANDGEVQVGQLAQGKATADSVKDFAQEMVDEHTATKERQGQLASRLGIAPQDNANSQKLRSDAAATLDMLQRLSGDPFDRAYIDSQVTMHTSVMNLIDGTLVPSVQNSEVRADLLQTRSDVSMHLQRARELQSMLANPMM